MHTMQISGGTGNFTTGPEVEGGTAKLSKNNI